MFVLGCGLRQPCYCVLLLAGLVRIRASRGLSKAGGILCLCLGVACGNWVMPYFCLGVACGNRAVPYSCRAGLVFDRAAPSLCMAWSACGLPVSVPDVAGLPEQFRVCAWMPAATGLSRVCEGGGWWPSRREILPCVACVCPDCSAFVLGEAGVQLGHPDVRASRGLCVRAVPCLFRGAADVCPELSCVCRMWSTCNLAAPNLCIA